MARNNNVPPPSPFFKPSTPRNFDASSVASQTVTPGGTRRQQKQQHRNDEVKEHKSGLLGCSANLITAIVGSGIVGIPYAIQQAGFAAGIFLVLLCAVMTDKSLRLLVATAKHVHCPTYETLAEAAYGRAGFLFITFMMGVMSYGAVISYLLILKDSLADVIGVDADNVAMRRALLIAVSLAVVVPLSSRRDMADLAFTSRINVVIDSCLVGLVVYNAPSHDSVQIVGGWKHLLLNDTIHYDTIFVGLGVLSFAFVCQHSAFIIAGSLEQPTIARWSKVTGSALIVCTILALTCGIAGYTGYLDATRGNILNNMQVDSWSANVARGMLGVTMLLVYPLESFVLRHVLVVLLFAGRRAHEGDDSAILNRRDRRIGLTVVLYLLAVIPASVFEDLGVVLALTGAIGGSSLCYIGPGMTYLGVHGERFLDLVRSSWLGSVLSSGDSEPKVTSLDLPPNSRVTSVESLAAVESTPLTSKPLDKGQTPPPPPPVEFWLLSLVKTTAWHILLMPCWCSIARTGKKGLNKHVHDMALKSPHPLRIGDVEYHRIDTSSTLGSADNDSNTNLAEEGFVALRREGSLPTDPSKAYKQQPAIIAVSPHAKPKIFTRTGETASIDQILGKEILQRKRQQQKQQRSAALEKDPQEQPPSWYDFYVAIFYMLFGVLALIAGLFSLATRPV